MSRAVIAITNKKGGVGKTSVACNLGHALAREGKKVLLCDMDHQCNLTELLMPGVSFQTSLYELFSPESDTPVDECIYPTKYLNLSLLPNVEETASLEPDLIKAQPNSLYIFKNKVRDYARKNFDVTLIDNSPSVGMFVLSSLYASDFAIVPHEFDSKNSLKGLKSAMKHIRDINKTVNPELRFLRFLANKVDRRTGFGRQVLESLMAVFTSEQVFNTVIPVNIALKKAEDQEETIFQFKPSSSSAIAYQALAREVIEILEREA